MPLKLLRAAFGLGGPAATRQTGYIARSFYIIGLVVAPVWILFFFFYPLQLQWGDNKEIIESIKILLFFLVIAGLPEFFLLWLVWWLVKRGLTAKILKKINNDNELAKEPQPLYRPTLRFIQKIFSNSESLVDKLAEFCAMALFLFVALSLIYFALIDLLSGNILFVGAFLLAILPGTLYVMLEAVKEWDWYRDTFILPKGPAARWGGILSFLYHDIGDFFPHNAEKIARQNYSTIYLGKTFAEQDPRLGCRHVGLRSQQHMMTVALTGAGKSRDAIWNTLLSWSGGAFVFDPKGEHVQCTFARRRAYKPAYALDPYRMVPHITETAHYNPLDEIDPDSPSAGADIVNVVEASLYIEKTEGANAAHFRENAQTVLKGFIAHVLTRYPQYRRNLPAVADLLATGAVEDSGDGDAYNIGAIKKVLEEMRSNKAVAKAPMWAMKVLDDVSPREAGGYLSTIYRGIRWVNDPPVRRTLLWSDFSLSDLKSKEISVYMVLPRRRIAEQIRWVRTLTTLAMFRCEHTAQPEGSKRKVLMLLDEFPQLGTFKPIKDGLVAVRSANIKLWVIFQNIGALTELYENAHDFYSSCDQQYFGVSATDDATKEHISKALGRYLKEHKEGRAGETHHQENIRELLGPDAVAQFLRSEGQNQIVFPAGKSLPLKLARVPFYKNCKSGTYGQVKDLDETLTQKHIDAELARFEHPIAEEREKARQVADEAARAERERQKAEKAAREQAKAQAADDFLDELKAHVDEAFKREGASPSYTPEQDAARQRFGLPVGFTWEQLKARYVEMAGDEEFSDIEQLNKDYETLLSVAKDDEGGKD